jgi:hypothetical protein
MKLENQVCSLELAKKLKELGVKQDSLFYWQQGYREMKGDVSASIFTLTQEKAESKKGMRCFSAFTVAELGEMLPAMTFSGGSESTFGKFRCWRYKERERASNVNDRDEFYADTEADARAKMLIYLLENALISLKKD